MMSTDKKLNTEVSTKDLKIKKDLPGLVKLDPWLEPYTEVIESRMTNLDKWHKTFSKEEGGFDKFTKSYNQNGFQIDNEQNVTYREWAPNAKLASLVGDFNQWDLESNKMTKDQFGWFECKVNKLSNGSCAIKHLSKVKICLTTNNGEKLYRLPSHARYVTQDLSISPIYECQFWNPTKNYQWKNDDNLIYNQRLKGIKNGSLKVYEAHVGISSPEGKVCSYLEFADTVLPKISELGYNAVQLMAIMEHAYYASFGYQVTNFFATSSRYGTPDEFKYVVDKAHSLGLVVLLDMVHSHASNNVLDGINHFDGSDHHLFHSGQKGQHELWNSRLFNYGNYETLRFLLSNLRFYMDVYHIDGFRFDGVTSMLYTHHGIGTGFSGHYDEYFTKGVDEEAVTYLMLANKMLHDYYPNSVTIAEDVSGMPGLCRPIKEGGIGFDYRLGMAVPDMWIKYLKEFKDEEWDFGYIVHTLTNRRYKEKTIAYCESHDQALVGDKTIAFWLMDKEMYTNMSTLTELTDIIDRGLSFHKMIRLLTSSLGGEGYLNFEGNEFGHPEWLDFPRLGNNSSFHYCRRQWHLSNDPILRYSQLNSFDQSIQLLDHLFGYLSSNQAYVSLKHQDDKIIVFERNDLIFLFNFNPIKSFENYQIGINKPGKYQIVLDSDELKFGGHGRIDHNKSIFFTFNEKWHDLNNSIKVYLPTRTALVLAPFENDYPLVRHPNPQSK